MNFETPQNNFEQNTPHTTLRSLIDTEKNITSTQRNLVSARSRKGTPQMKQMVINNIKDQIKDLEKELATSKAVYEEHIAHQRDAGKSYDDMLTKLDVELGQNEMLLKNANDQQKKDFQKRNEEIKFMINDINERKTQSTQEEASDTDMPDKIAA